MGKRYQERPKDPLRVRDMLSDLTSARPGLARLRGQGKEYDALIDELQTMSWPFPASKVLQEKLGLTAGKLRKLPDTLYWDFLTAIEENPDVLQFTQVVHLFCAPGFRDYRTFQCRLAVTPRVGDTIYLPFLAGVTGSGRYYVDSIEHEYEEEKVCITVHLKSGIYNQHLAYLQDQALFEGKLTYGMMMELRDYGIKDYLRTQYGPPLPAPPVFTPAPAPASKRRGRKF
ncbi:hypothetical protein GCM10023172_01110 [Hymenobacter ginsengisoli]|uniref:Uncharacterized protein n=1 Tax=Hymenobacter ginsengisoli TaxID=1051626 RepID=A0ABP8PUW0_9BACT|nr:MULTISPECIES: hypothetical protein [unclassified Hymenobacter]MBO2033509.1 hypothetical protein [Hymenobacter sp. BT559]